MARIRTIKPELFRHEVLFEAESDTGLPLRLAFAGLFCCCDREGRFEWRPRQLKLDVLPYDNIDFSRVLEALNANGLVVKYYVDGVCYGCIPSFLKHQVINQREAKSKIPSMHDAECETHVHARAEHRNDIPPSDKRIPTGINIPNPLREKVLQRDQYKCVRCGSTDDLTIDHIFPRSIGGTHAIQNLRVLCRSCNSARPVAGKALEQDLALDGLTLNDKQKLCGTETHVHAHDLHSTSDSNARGELEGEQGKGIDKRSCAEIKNLDAKSEEPTVITLPLTAKDGNYHVPTSDFEKYQECFPALDIMQELRQMLAWLDANPKNRKTRTGIKAFITRWLGKSQNKAPTQRASGNYSAQDIDWDVPTYGEAASQYQNNTVIEGEVV